MRSTGFLALFVVVLVGCGDAAAPAAPEQPAAKPDAPSAATSGSPEAPAAPSPAAPASEAPASASASLARDFVKSGGRFIAYSESKKAFAYPVAKRQSGGTASLDVRFVAEDGAAKDTMSVCKPGECEEHLDEIAKTFIPKLAARFDADGYAAIRAIGWPSGRNELEVNTLNMKLKYTRGQIEGQKAGKPARFTFVGGKRLDAATLDAIFLVPGGKLLAVFQASTPEAGVELSVLKAP